MTANVRLRVNGIEEPDERAVSMTVRHTCNHERTHQYATANAALMDRERQRKRKCPGCREVPK